MSNTAPRFFVFSGKTIIEESKVDPVTHGAFFLMDRDDSGLSFVKVHGGKIYAYEYGCKQYVEID